MYKIILAVALVIAAGSSGAFDTADGMVEVAAGSDQMNKIDTLIQESS
ncbi:MAG: hypothetical protein V7696_17370 [Halioglobus sp.]